MIAAAVTTGVEWLLGTWFSAPLISVCPHRGSEGPCHSLWVFILSKEQEGNDLSRTLYGIESSDALNTDVFGLKTPFSFYVLASASICQVFPVTLQAVWLEKAHVEFQQ